MKMIELESGGGSRGHYSPAVLSNGMLYVSGQLSMDPETRQIPVGGIEEHTRVALRNLDRVLKAAGLARGSVVQCRVYVADMDQWDAVNKVYAEFFGEHKPARVVVPAGKLDCGCLVEIEAIAEAGRGRDMSVPHAAGPRKHPRGRLGASAAAYGSSISRRRGSTFPWWTGTPGAYSDIGHSCPWKARDGARFPWARG